MVRAIRAFLEFCYIVRKNVLDTSDLEQLQDALDRFRQYRQIFISTGVRDNFDLPRQHSIVHFRQLIRAFGAPNGLCSSITESKHIKAVKEPWRRSSRYKATIQMLTTNTRLDKFAAMRTNFVRRGMLPPILKSRPTPSNVSNPIISVLFTHAISSGAVTTRRQNQSARASRTLVSNDTEADDEDSGDVPGPRSMASVELAKVPSGTSTQRHHIICVVSFCLPQLSI